jgi:hypothetical protein
VACRKEWTAACDASAPVVQWRATPDFSGSADQLAVDGKTVEIDSLTSTDPVNEPHRIYGLREMLVKFYRECLQAHDPASSTFAQIRFCLNR